MGNDSLHPRNIVSFCLRFVVVASNRSIFIDDVIVGDHIASTCLPQGWRDRVAKVAELSFKLFLIGDRQRIKHCSSVLVATMFKCQLH